mgnify:CR=1 FL=1
MPRLPRRGEAAQEAGGEVKLNDLRGTRCTECGADAPCVSFPFVSSLAIRRLEINLCADCIRVAGIILARAEKDAAKDDVPAPEGERR